MGFLHQEASPLSLIVKMTWRRHYKHDGRKDYLITLDMRAISENVAAEAPRLAKLGTWPSWIDARASLSTRIPSGDKSASGFDAGIACALGLIPQDKQKLSAILHAAYTEAAVEQVRRESEDLDADSETAWWLAACSICDEEGPVNAAAFAAQIEAFDALRNDQSARVKAALAALDAMKQGFILKEGIAFATRDGGMQGAYLAGHDWAVHFREDLGIWFIGTFRDSLGLEDFMFSSQMDNDGRPMSGPVHGSQQFMKASSEAELARILPIVRAKLG